MKLKSYTTSFDTEGQTHFEFIIQAFDRDTALAKGAQKLFKGIKILTASAWENKEVRTIECKINITGTSAE